MLKYYYVKTRLALQRLGKDEDGVVSFEYIIVACCIIAAVGLVFGPTGTTNISSILAGGLGNISSAFALAIPTP
jgi:pilus assembly protein Flp/PilA